MLKPKEDLSVYNFEWARDRGLPAGSSPCFVVAESYAFLTQPWRDLNQRPFIYQANVYIILNVSF